MKKTQKLLAFLMVMGMLLTGLPVFAAGEGSTAIYAVNKADYTYHPVPAADFAKVEKALDLPAAKTTVAKGRDVGGFCVFTKSGKSLYMITETQVLKDGKPLRATADQRKSLLALCKDYCIPGTGIPELLGYMSPGKITKVAFDGLKSGTGPNASPWIEFDMRKEDAPTLVNEYAQIMKTLTVAAGSTKVQKPFPVNTTTDVMGATISFDTGVTYHITLWDSAMFIYSTDASVPGQGYHYEFTHNTIHPRGWYLRAEMESLAQPYAGLEEAILINMSPAGPACVQITGESPQGRLALGSLSAFSQRFRQPVPIGIKSPPAGSAKNPKENWVGIFMKPKDGDSYEELWLWGDQQGGRWVDAEGLGVWNAALPGDTAHMLSLMASGDSILPGQAQKYLKTLPNLT